MPELPEVAGLAGFLNEQLQGAVFTKLQIVSFAVLKTADPPFTALEGRTVAGVQRFGKFLSIDTGGIFFVFHLARAATSGSSGMVTSSVPGIRRGCVSSCVPSCQSPRRTPRQLCLYFHRRPVFRAPLTSEFNLMKGP